MIKATIFDIQRGSFVDGPGIRTTVFFKGCQMRCAWCHNPEGQTFEPQILRDKVCGQDYTVDELLPILLKDRRFYEVSGGVTFSGGECMLQIEFLEALLHACREHGIHTAVDTAGDVPFDRFARILPLTDLFLYDIKCADTERHRQYTGVGNERILENLRLLLDTGATVWVRIPIIPTVNDTEEEMRRIKEILASCKSPERIELLPYHGMGEHKYRDLGIPPPAFSVPAPDMVERLNRILNNL